jgi:hypothetical protein
MIELRLVNGDVRVYRDGEPIITTVEAATIELSSKRPELHLYCDSVWIHDPETGTYRTESQRITVQLWDNFSIHMDEDYFVGAYAAR